jgi:hypothetical protein
LVGQGVAQQRVWVLGRPGDQREAAARSAADFDLAQDHLEVAGLVPRGGPHVGAVERDHNLVRGWPVHRCGRRSLGFEPPPDGVGPVAHADVVGRLNRQQRGQDPGGLAAGWVWKHGPLKRAGGGGYAARETRDETVRPGSPMPSTARTGASSCNSPRP